MSSDSNWYRDEVALVTVLQRGRRFRTPTPAIDGYDDLHAIARGGQGVVYAAVQRSTKRRVAIKVLSDSAAIAGSSRRRFEREIELVAALRHSNIVSVYDSGTAPDGRPYFVMEYIDGQPLDKWISDFRFPIRARNQSEIGNVLRLFIKICAGVQHAHQRGVIHRDLKPSNILVDHDGDPHVLDFGVARWFAASDIGSGKSEIAHLTTAGGFVGTLAYAAPEQLKADPSLVDVRTDVYALGVLLYLMLTGRHPYPVSGPVAEVVQAVTHHEPPPPSHREHPARWGRTRAVFDKELDAIALKALAKDPERRYQSIAALRQDVERYLAGEPIEARRDSTWYVLGKVLRRHRLAVAISAVFLTMLLGFSAAMAVLYQQAHREADKLRQVNFFLEDTLGSVEARVPAREVTVRELLDEGVQWIDIALGAEPEIEAAVRAILGNGYRNLGDYGDAERELLAALESRRQLFGVEHVEVARSLGQLALLRRDQLRLDEAEQLLRQALDLRRRLLGQDHLDVAMSLNNLAMVLHAAGRSLEAEPLLREALAIRRAQLGDRHADVAMTQFNLALLAESMGDFAEAAQLHRAVLETRRSALHAGHPDIPRSLVALATLLMRRGDASAAEPLLRECLAIHQEFLPLDHWRVAETRSLLGSTVATAGRYAEAEPLLLGGYAGLEATLREDDARLQPARERIIALYQAWGRPADVARWRTPLTDK